MNISRILAFGGSTGFVGIVTYLHFTQKGYSPAEQLMSELALGEQGFLMLHAFLLLASSVAGCVGLLASCRAPGAILAALGAASLSLAGAGVFKLGSATVLHITLVALAFVLLVLVMYLAPRHVEALKNAHGKAACWGLGTGTALMVALGHAAMPMGIAQRLAACCILLWMCWLALFIPQLQARIPR